MKKKNLEVEMAAILFSLVLIFELVTTAPLTSQPETASATTNVQDTGKPTSQNDKDIFWEVTKQPPGITPMLVTKDILRGSEFVDGNHPNLPPVLTHEEVDTDFNHGLQTKRVKKILPPFNHKSETRDVGKLLAELNETNVQIFKNSEPLRSATVEELTVTEIRNNPEDVIPEFTQQKIDSKYTIGYYNNLKPIRPAMVEELTVTEVRSNPSDVNFEMSNVSLSQNQTEETHNTSNTKIMIDIDYQSNGSDDIFIPVAPTEMLNIQSSPSIDVTANETRGEILHVTPAADGIFEETPSEKLGNGQAKIIMPTTTTHFIAGEEGDLEIEGIRLIPEEKHSTTERTMWDMIQEQQNSASEEAHLDENNVIYPEAPRALPFQGQSQTAKPLFGNFDAESQEMEYESENFQHGFSNIEKHELPLSYALPWLQVQDKVYENEKDSDKLRDTKEKDLESRSRLAAVSSDEEELRIPADMSRLLRLSELPELGADVAVSVVQSGATDTEPRGRTKWYLLLLTGNSTIVQRRRDDFTKYLRLNLAARLSVEYDDVKVNKLILAPPRVLVNVSVYAPSDDIAEESQLDLKEKFEEKGEGPLHKLAESNATLLELSGEEFKVVRFLSLQGQQPAAEAQKDTPRLASMSARHDDIEFVIYTFLGSACACAILLTIFIALNKYFKKWKEVQWPWKQLKTHKMDSLPKRQEQRCSVPPAVIYSGGFPQIRGSWMGPPGSSEPPSVTSSSASLLQRYPGIELGASQPDSPRHSKLSIYNCRADRVLVRKLQDNNCSSSLDVRIPDPTKGADNPTFTN